VCGILGRGADLMYPFGRVPTKTVSLKNSASWGLNSCLNTFDLTFSFPFKPCSGALPVAAALSQVFQKPHPIMKAAIKAFLQILIPSRVSASSIICVVKGKN
jgi:hypothetical protein